jgi:hypothetical protein
MVDTAPVVNAAPAVKEFPPFKPIAYFGGNLLLGGLSYVMLRQYARFFIYFGLIIVTSFIPFVNYIIVFGSAFDAYFLAKKFKAKELPEPKHNAALMWTAIATWILLIILAVTLYWFASLAATNHYRL